YIVRPLGTLDPWSVRRKRLQKKILMRFGVQALLTGAAAMHYTSADEMCLAESAVSPLQKGVVVPLGIDDALFADSAGGAGGPSPYVLALARLDVKKGLDLLIRSFHDLASDARFQTWRLVIAGDGN